MCLAWGFGLRVKFSMHAGLLIVNSVLFIYV